MKASLLAAGCLLASASAWGQEPPKLTLSLTVEQAMLIVQVLGQVGGCDRVAGMAQCRAAEALLEEIRSQAKQQGK